VRLLTIRSQRLRARCRYRCVTDPGSIARLAVEARPAHDSNAGLAAFAFDVPDDFLAHSVQALAIFGLVAATVDGFAGLTQAWLRLTNVVLTAEVVGASAARRLAGPALSNLGDARVAGERTLQTVLAARSLMAALPAAGA